MASANDNLLPLTAEQKADILAHYAEEDIGTLAQRAFGKINAEVNP